MCQVDDPEVQELLQSNIPIVTVDYVYHNCTVVSSNNVKGMNDWYVIFIPGDIGKLHTFMGKNIRLLPETG